MKRILFLTCIGTLALSLTAVAAPNKGKSAGGPAPARGPAVSARGGGGHAMRGPAMNHAAAMPAQRNFSQAPVQRAPRNFAAGPSRSRSNVAVQPGNNIRHANAAAFRNEQRAAVARNSQAN